MSKSSIPSLQEILDLISEMNSFTVDDYVISTIDGKYQLDVKSLLENSSKIPIKMFAVDDEKQFVRFEFENGQVAVLNPDGDSWNISGHAPPSFVYLISDGIGLTKIGISSDPMKRIKMLQTASPNKLELLACWKCKNANKSEKHLHKIYSKLHVHGEWFRLSEGDIEDIRNYFDGIDR